MLKTGLVSITFRKLQPREIITLVEKAGLNGIEWGGDIHVPHGDTGKAREVSTMTADAGLSVAAYGSYYYVGCEEQYDLSFDRVLETACELKVPTIRVWAGNRGSGEADEAWWDRVVGESRRISDMAGKCGITISFEYHGNTLTDTSDSAVRLLKEVDGDNVLSYWQPPLGLDLEQRLEGLNRIIPWLGNIHVFWWDEHIRLPLSEGEETWIKYIEAIKAKEGNRYCMLEFVKDDSPMQFLEDANILKRIVNSLTI